MSKGHSPKTLSITGQSNEIANGITALAVLLATDD